MEKSEVVLTIGNGHCIESAAKQEYNSLMVRVMADNTPADPDDEARLELLIEFLENADFAVLRASDERFTGIGEACCTLKRNERGGPVLVINE